MAASGDRSGAVLDSEQAAIGVDLKPLFEKLKPGPGLPADQVIADQRRRLHGAMIALVDQSGWDAVRVRSLAKAAGVSTATFYKHFANADDCLASTYDAVIDEVVSRAAAAQRRQVDWRASLRATVGQLMEDFATEPRATRLALVDIFGAGPVGRKRVGPAVGQLEALVSSNFATAPRNITPPRHLVAGMTAGILRVARTTTLTGRATELPTFVGEVTTWLLSLPSPDVLYLLAPSSRAADLRRREREPFPAENAADGARLIGDDRERLQRAVVSLVERESLAKITGPQLRAEAGVSKRRYESCYRSVEECYLDGIERLARDAAARSDSWARASRRWETRTCRFVLGVCAQAARGRTRTRLVLQGLLAAGAAGLLRRESMIAGLASRLQATVHAAVHPSEIGTEASVAAIWHVAQLDVASGRSRNLPAIAPLLSYIALAPIVGSSTACAAIRDEVGVRSLLLNDQGV